MSVNRSVQAAQRRRTGPSEAVPTRGPQPSINSSQMFANPPRPGSSQGMPAGRVNGKQQMQQQQNTSGSLGKLSVAQAITLITLRLGSLENKVSNFNDNQTLTSGLNINEEGLAIIDQTVIESIISRLESLEKRSSTPTSNPEINLIKQQFEPVKQAVVQTKTNVTNLLKENKSLKNEVDNLRNDLIQTREFVESLHSVILENNQKLMGFSMEGMEEFVEGDFSNMNTEIVDESQLDSMDEIAGMNLKEEIENQLNASLEE
jgi:regulator of replication initiation timing